MRRLDRRNKCCQGVPLEKEGNNTPQGVYSPGVGSRVGQARLSTASCRNPLTPQQADANTGSPLQPERPE